MSKASDEARRRWIAEKNAPGPNDKPNGFDKSSRDAWMNTKRANEQTHVHFMCTCHACAQEFAICGLPCFVICPGCHATLKMQMA